MGDSANQVLFSIIRGRGLMPERKLKDALAQARREGRPLEQVLMQSGLLSATICEHVVQERARSARACAHCAKFTYLLEGRTEQDTPCDHCGEPLMPNGDPNKPLRSRPKPPPIRMRGTGAHRRGGEPERAAPSRPAARPGPASAASARPGAPARPGTPPARKPPLQTGKATRKAVETRLDETKAADAIGKLVAMVEARLTTPEALERFAKLATEHALTSVADKLEDQYLGALPSRISEEVTERVLATVERRMGKDTLPQISQKVTRRALEAVEKRLEDEDLAGLTDRIQELTRQELEQNLETMRAEAVLAAVQAPSEGGAPSSGAEVDAIDARVAQVEEQLAQLDPAELPERVTERALESFWSRLEHAGLEGLPSRVVEELLARVQPGAAGEADASRPTPTGAEPDQATIAAHVLESMWAHLEEHGAAGFPQRVIDETVAKAVGALQEAGPALQDGSDLLGRLEALEASLSDMGTSVGEVESGSRLDRLEESLTALHERLEGGAGAVAPSSGGGSGWEVPFDALAGRVRFLEEETGSGSGGVESGGVETRVAALEAALQGWSPSGGGGDPDLIRRLEALEGSDLIRRLDLVEQQVSRAAPGETDAAITSITRRLSALETDGGSGSDLDVVPRLSQGSEQLTELEQRLEAFQARLERLGASSDTGDLPAAVEEFSVRLAQLERRLEQVEQAPQAVAGGGAADGEVLSALETKLDELDDRQGVALSALVERVSQLEAPKAGGDLAGQVAALSQRFETLVPSEVFMELLKRVTVLEGRGGGAAADDDELETVRRRLHKLERNLVEIELGSPGGSVAMERLEQLEAQVAEGGGAEAGAGADPALAEELRALERRLGEFEMGAGSGTGALEEIEALQAKVSLLEERLEAGGSGSGSGEGSERFSEEFVEQVVQLALEQVKDRLEAGDEERLAGKVLERLQPQLDEQLGVLQASTQSGIEVDLESQVTAEVEEQLAMAGLSAVGEQAKQAALEVVQAQLNEALGPEALSGQLDAALRDALEGLDVRQLAERVAMQAVGPVMEAIDGRLEGFDPGELKPLLEELKERVRVLELGGYS